MRASLSPGWEACRPMFEHEAVWRLFHRYPHPAFVTDRRGVVRRVNRAAESALGWRSDEVVGRASGEFVRAPEPPSILDTLPRDASEVAHGEVEARTSSGHWMRYGAEVRTLGDSELLVVELLRPRPTPPSPRRSSLPPPGQPLLFEIDTSSGAFGTVCFSAPGTRLEVGDRCYALLFERNEPCKLCPAQELEPGRTATGTYHHGGYYHAVRCSWVSPTLAAVEAQRFDEVLVRELVGARLATLASHAGLSQREQDVFELLVLGRSLVEIAKVLGITTRTVRFHQANVLSKLGADSRLDLLRLLL